MVKVPNVYDSANQLTRENNQAAGKTWTWAYDDVGNILSASDGTTTHTYTYGNAGWKDLLTAVDGQTITYDYSSNPLSYYNGARWTFGWANGRNLVSASGNGKTISYSYDLSGQRASKTADGVTHTYLYAGGKLLRETYGSNTLDFFYDANGTPYALKYNGTVYYYITNLQGDVIQIVNSSGTVVASYDYDPYGKVISATGDLAEINPLRYRGYYYDSETQLYYLQSRYYDPELGRFVNADAYASTGQGLLGNNMFAYCQNNPVVYTDPSGKRIVGAGVQGEMSIGGISVGIEIVIYFDPEVCKDADFLIVVYTYSGYELSADQLSSIIGLIDIAAVAACVETSYSTYGESDFQSYMDNSLLGQALRGILTKGGSVTGAFFAIDADDNFDEPSDYSGKFESYTFSGAVNGKTCGVFYSYADKCRAIGVKGGLTLPSGKRALPCPISFGLSYSVTYYSDPYIIYEG